MASDSSKSKKFDSKDRLQNEENCNVFITGCGAVSSAGTDPEVLYRNVVEGYTGLKSVFIEGLEDPFGLGVLDEKYDPVQLSTLAIDQALAQSKLNSENLPCVFLSLGTSVGGMGQVESNMVLDEKTLIQSHWATGINDKLQSQYAFKDSICFSTACTSSGNAIKFAKELIVAGLADIVIAGGVDSICDTTVQGFNALSVLSKENCKPFDENRTGMNIGEGAAFLVIESEKSVNKRNVRPLAELVGCGSSSDAAQITAPDVDGVMAAMEKAVVDAGISFMDIDYVNAHGTGTIKNDETEANAIDTLFGNRVSFSSTKHITGHLLGAASAIEAVISVYCLQKGKILGNSTTSTPISDQLNLSVRNKLLNYVMSNSLAFGGNNVSLLFGRV